MVRSVIFNQAPDWAKIIGDSYASVNASEEYNEQLEKQNDAVRIANAGDAIKVFKAVAEFSATAKKAADTYAKNKIENENWNRWKKGSDDVHKTIVDDAAEDFENKKYDLDIKIADEISETNAAAANDFKKESEVIKYKKNLGSLRQDAVEFKNTIFQIADQYQAGGVQYSAVTDFAQSQEILGKAFSDSKTKGGNDPINGTLGEIYKEFTENKNSFSIYKGIKIIRVPIYPRKKGRINLTLRGVSQNGGMSYPEPTPTPVAPLN